MFQEESNAEVHDGSGGVLRHLRIHRDLRGGDLRHQVPGLEAGRSAAAGQERGQRQGEAEQGGGHPFSHGSLLLLLFYSYRRKGRVHVPENCQKQTRLKKFAKNQLQFAILCRNITIRILLSAVERHPAPPG